MKDERYFDGQWYLVQYHLSLMEWCQYIIAIILAYATGKRIADYMSEDLEELMCCFIPSRHSIIKKIEGE